MSADESWYERVGLGAVQVVEGIGSAVADLTAGGAEFSLQLMQKAGGNAYIYSGPAIQLMTGAGIAVAEGIYNGSVTLSSVGTAVGDSFVQGCNNLWYAPAEMAKGNIAQGTHQLTSGAATIVAGNPSGSRTVFEKPASCLGSYRKGRGGKRWVHVGVSSKFSKANVQSIS